MNKVINHIEIETFVHATESLEKVFACLESLGVDKSLFEEVQLEGHYGNPIIGLFAHISKRRDIESFLSSPFLFSTRCELAESLEARIDENGVLFFRADKQDLCRAEYVLRDRGDIRMTIKFLAFPQRRETVIKNARQLLCD